MKAQQIRHTKKHRYKLRFTTDNIAAWCQTHLAEGTVMQHRGCSWLEGAGAYKLDKGQLVWLHREWASPEGMQGMAVLMVVHC
jgi:hypothetical protein